MDPMQQDMFQSYAKSCTYKKRLYSTNKIIRELLSDYSNVCVAVSGGKDSLVMLDLILKQHPKVLVWHWDWGMFMLRHFENEILENLRNHFKLQYPQLTVRKRLTMNEEKSVGFRAMFGSVGNFIKERKINLMCLGLRKEESCRRGNRCSVLVEHIKPCPNAFPIRDWTWRDIWGHIIINKIPYPSAYDIRAPLIGWDKTRFVSFFDPEFDHLAGPDQDKYFFYKYRER